MDEKTAQLSRWKPHFRRAASSSAMRSGALMGARGRGAAASNSGGVTVLDGHAGFGHPAFVRRSEPHQTQGTSGQDAWGTSASLWKRAVVCFWPSDPT